MRRPVYAFAACALLAAAGGSQDGGRVRIGGRVTAANGTPWAGARVVLLARPAPRFPSIGKADRIEATTDAAGRFRARVRKGWRYSAWAVSPPDGGRYRATRVEEEIAGDTNVRLREQHELVHVRLRVQGRPGWKAEEPIRFQLVTDATRNIDILPLRLDARNECMLPPVAAPRCWVEALGRSGKRLLRAPVELRPGPRKRAQNIIAGEPLLPVGFTAVKIPAPFPVIVRCSEFQQPDARIAGVELLQVVRGELVPWTKSDGNGRAVVPLPLDHVVSGRFESAGLRFAARTAGRTTIVTEDTWTVRFGYYRDFERLLREDRCDKQLVLPTDGELISGRVTLDGERPAAGLPLVLYQDQVNEYFQEAEAPLILRTDADGRFSAKGRSMFPYRLSTVLPESVRKRYATAAGSQPLPLAILDVDVPRGVPKKIDLSALQLFEIAAKRPDGMPAQRARLALFDSAALDSRRPHRPFRFRGDRRGTARFVGPRGLEPIVVVRAGEHVGVTQAWEGRGGTRRSDVAFREKPVITGIVRDARGRPAAGARLSFWPRAGLAERLTTAMRLAGSLQVRADARGRFRFAVPLPYHQWDVLAGSRRRPTTFDVRDVQKTGLQLRLRR